MSEMDTTDLRVETILDDAFRDAHGLDHDDDEEEPDE